MKTAIGLLVCAGLIASTPLGAGDKNDTAKFDPSKMLGKWTYVSGIKNGEKVSEENLKGHIEITKDRITLQSKEVFVMKYELDAKKTPATIKLEMTESPFGAGAKSQGIIELKGDQLKLCYTPMGEDAPTTFDAKEGSKAHLFVLKRAK